MNVKVRKFLIDQCVKGVPIFYEAIGKMLNLNFDNPADRLVLIDTLSEISTFEYEQGRPLISAIAIYKQSNDHGQGFYKLCEVLNIGKASDLRDQYFGFTALEDSKKYWQNKSNYDRFYELNTPTFDLTNAPPFFNLAEIAYFKEWCDKTYDPQNPDHVDAKNYLMQTVWSKTKFWAIEVAKKLTDYESSTKMVWQKRGKWIDKKPTQAFKPYTWSKIFKKGDENKGIFFTIGVSPDYLLYKLDFAREDDTLSKEQKELCTKYIPRELVWEMIPLSELKDNNWESLINKIVLFVKENTHHYDNVVDKVWNNQEPIQVSQNTLTLKSYPMGGLTNLPTLNPSFKGYDTTDFIKKNIENKELGDAGEELVRNIEANKLRKKGMTDYADKVNIVKDGEGYDILSFDDNGNEKYIEVKTTEGNEKTPFYLSLNEYLFCERNRAKYCIYRLYNYDFDTNHADYIIIEDPLNMLLFQPISYQVYLKKQ